MLRILSELGFPRVACAYFKRHFYQPSTFPSLRGASAELNPLSVLYKPGLLKFRLAFFPACVHSSHGARRASRYTPIDPRYNQASVRPRAGLIENLNVTRVADTRTRHTHTHTPIYLQYVYRYTIDMLSANNPEALCNLARNASRISRGNNRWIKKFQAAGERERKKPIFLGGATAPSSPCPEAETPLG